MAQKNEVPALIITLLITLGLLGAGYWFWKNKIASNDTGARNPSVSAGNRQSSGDSLMIPADSTENKRAGIEAFGKGNYSEAIERFQASLKEQPNDPETRIYLDNARAAAKNPLKIAVVVPIGGNLNVAKEILRGVAQAQEEVDRAGGIDGRGLQVTIVNDDNVPKVSRAVAADLVKDPEILAVIGHNSSDATLAAAPEYQKGGLVMISPTSNSAKISPLGDYIFRTIPTIGVDAETLARYSVESIRQKNVAICIDSKSNASRSLSDAFRAALTARGGKAIDIDCDFVAGNFNADAIVPKAIANGAGAILLNPSIDRLNGAISVARSNGQRLPLLGASTMYTFQTLERGQEAVNGMVLVAPWHPDAFPNNPFPANARKLWGGDVSWRSALAYDATRAVIEGLKKSGGNRQALQKTLAASDFSANGASGAIRFLPSGDRRANLLLVEIVPGQKSATGFDFVPIR
ncbi:ABC transporter substrate-binding protein [Pannus brasiliensis CCIBt3594]|uniref:ABC transporter substrate-binding protein n=1 Tax=Pannus brasiliensis CCIBt3594 TaxID=1427578 RepID=A0AAW9QUN5_9CHRO